MKPLIIAPGSYAHTFGLNAPMRNVNVYAERMEGVGRKAFVQRGAPGMKSFCDPTASVQPGAAGQNCRGMTNFNGTTYGVIGQYLIAIDSAGTPTEPFAGIAIPGTGPVSFAENRAPELFICTSGQDMIITGGSLGQATGDNMPDFSDVIEIDGRLLGIPASPASGEAGRVYYSNADAFTSFESTGFFNAESDPDGSSALLRIGRLVIVFGTDTVEAFYSTGDTTPFQRHADGIRGVGIAATGSRASIAGADANYGFFLAKSKQARLSVQMISESGQLARISTNALEETMDGFTTYSDAEGYVYSEKGHTFYILKFPTEKRCFAYDLATNLWHDRQSGTKEVAGWDGRFTHVAHDKVLVGAEDGKIYELDHDTHTDRGNTRLRQCMAMAQASGGFHNSMSAIFVECKTGVTPASATTESKLMLEWSKNGGESWHADTRYKGIGLKGQRLRDNGVKWAGFGEFTGSFVAKVQMTDPGELYIKDIFGDGAPGASV